MRKHIIITIGFVIMGLGLAAQDKWDLRTCVEYALSNNISVKQQDIQARLSELTYKQSKDGQYPTLGFGVSNGVNFGRSINPTSNQFENTQLFFTGFGLNANVDLFNWFSKRYTIQANQLDMQAAQAGTEKIKNDIALNVAVAYLQILLAREQVKVVEGQLSQRLVQLEVTRKKINGGVLPELNGVEIETQLANDSSALITAKASVEQALLQLKAILNLDAGVPFDITTPPVDRIPVEALADCMPEAVYALAIKNFPQQRVNDLRYKSIEKSIEAARRAFYPSISMNASSGSNYANSKFTFNQQIPNGNLVPTGLKARVGATDYDVLSPGFDLVPKTIRTSFGKQMNENFRQSVGLNINVPIFNGGANRTNLARAKLNAKNIELSRMADDQKLKQDIYKAYNDATTALQKFNANKKTVEFAQRTLDFSTRRYELGLLPTFDVLTAQNNLFKAKIDVVSAQFDYVFKMKVLEYYKGLGLKL
jgi:outer membrane protein